MLLITRFLSLFIALLLLSSTVLGQPQQPLPLHELINHQFPTQTVLSKGKIETAVYEATDSTGGIDRNFILLCRTRLTPLNREFYVLAKFPYGQKPLIQSVHQTWKTTITTMEVTEHHLMILDQSAENFGQLLRFQSNIQMDEKFSMKDFQLWDGDGKAVFLSPHDGDQSGEFPLKSSLKDYLEEELLLALRGLPFEDGLRATLWLYPRQNNTRCTLSRPELASLTVTKDEKGWEVFLRTRDERQIQFLFAPELPHALLAFHHSDGRSLKLKAIEYTND